jgi:hypothetical protein
MVVQHKLMVVQHKLLAVQHKLPVAGAWLGV